MFDIWKSTNRSRTKGCRLRAARAGSWAKMSFPFLSPTLLFFLQIRSSFNQLLGSVEQILTAFLLCKMHFHGNRKGTKTYGEKKTLIKTSTGITPKHPQEVPFSYIIVLIIWKTCFFFPKYNQLLFYSNKIKTIFEKCLWNLYFMYIVYWHLHGIPFLANHVLKKFSPLFYLIFYLINWGFFSGGGLWYSFFLCCNTCSSLWILCVRKLTLTNQSAFLSITVLHFFKKSSLSKI